MIMRIPLFKPHLGDEELHELAGVFKSAWVGMGPKTVELEAKVARANEVEHAVGVTSCTAALQLSLEALGVTSGEVIIPPITHAATANAVMFNGAKPVFADVEEDTLCIDPEDIERKITKKTRAIIPVHLGGHSCDMDAIMKIARRHKLVVIEDCANAQGARYKGKMVGSIGNAGCLSFESKKNMTTGDGGMILTSDAKIAERLRRLRFYGTSRDTWSRFSGVKKYTWQYDVVELGWKYNMNDIHAAIGLAQFKKLPWMLRQKDRIRNIYNRGLAGIPWLKTPKDRPYTKSGWWLYIIRVEARDRFVDYLSSKGITTGVHFEPIYHHSYLKKRGIRSTTPVAEWSWLHLVSLPYFPTMTDKEIRYVIEMIKKFGTR